MRLPARACHEPRIVLPFGMADEIGEREELVLAHDLHHDIAVGRAEPLADDLESLAGLGPHTERPEVGDDVGHRDDRIEHRDVDVLAESGVITMTQRGQHADHAEERRADVTERADGDRHRRLPRMAVVVDARHCLDDRRVRGPVAIRRRDRVAEARDRHVDRGRMRGRDRVVPEAHAIHRPGLEVLRDHIEARYQCKEQLASLGRFEIETYAALVEVVAQIGRPDLATVGVEHRGRRRAARLAVFGVLHLHDFRAEAGQELRGIRQRLHLLGREHAYAVERLAVLLRVGVCGLSQAHASRLRTTAMHAPRRAIAIRSPRAAPTHARRRRASGGPTARGRRPHSTTRLTLARSRPIPRSRSRRGPFAWPTNATARGDRRRISSTGSSRMMMPRSYSAPASRPSGSTSLKPSPASSAFHWCTSPCTSTARSSSCALIRRSAQASA